MSRLAELLPFNAGETISSYCSRLSAACGYRHARSFGNDLGFRFQGLAVGIQADIDKFEDIIDVPRSTLASGVVAADERITMICRQQFTRVLAQRQRIRCCPLCLRDDELEREGRRGFRAYGRLLWLATPVRVCRRHGVRLVTSENTVRGSFVHDFAANLAAEGDGMSALLSSAVPMEPDGLQGYVEARLQGRDSGSAWLDSLPLYVAVRICEAVGASELHGIWFHSTKLDERQLSICAGTGFDILKGGEENFRTWLRGHFVRFEGRIGNTGGCVVFGRLYERLAHETSDKAYDPVRRIMRDMAMSNLPLGPGDDFFGPVTDRKLHSVQSASTELGVDARRLQKMLVNSGKIPMEDTAKTFERILLEANEMTTFVNAARESLTAIEAKRRLGAGRIQFDILVKLGFIQPFGGDRCAKELLNVDRRFAPSELEIFLDRVRSAATMEVEPGMSNIATTMKKATCTFAEIMELLLAGRLMKVALAAGDVGIAAVRVHANEIKAFTMREHHGCLTISKVAKQFPVSHDVMKALIESGRMPTVERMNSVKRYMQKVIEPHAFSAFVDEFVSLANLVTARRTKPSSLERALAKAGVVPAFWAASKPFYRRSEVEAV